SAGRLRIPRPQRQELDGAALDGGVGPPGAVGVDVPLRVAVVGRVAVEDHPRRAPLLRLEYLHPPEALAVASEDDPPAHADPELVERVETLGAAVVRVDDLPRGPPARAVTVEGGQDLRAVGILVPRVPRLPQRQLPLLRDRHL